MSLSIVIPCKNESEIIHKTVEHIHNNLKKTNINFEIILINDFSNDNTETVLKSLQNKYPTVVYYNNSKIGLGSAISLGINKSQKKYLVIFMADMSDDINDLIKYHEMISKKNLDSIFGSRFLKNSKIIDYPIFKLILNRIFNNFVRIIFLTKFNDFTNAFKIYKVDTLKELLPIVSENFNTFLELPLKILSRGYSFEIISINWTNRKLGSSKFKVKELTSKYIFTLSYCFLEKNLLKKRK